MYANIKTDDLFLTLQRQCAVSSEFLTDDSHFTLSDDESETKEDEGIDAKVIKTMIRIQIQILVAFKIKLIYRSTFTFVRH